MTGTALKNRTIAQLQESLALLWARLAALPQIIPYLGPVLALIGPVIAMMLQWTIRSSDSNVFAANPPSNRVAPGTS